MITNRIIKALVQFEVDTGRKPARIYLGREEWHELRHRAKATSCIFVGEAFSKESRFEFRGVPVFLVNEEEHLVVA